MSVMDVMTKGWNTLFSLLLTNLSERTYTRTHTQVRAQTHICNTEEKTISRSSKAAEKIVVIFFSKK